MSSYLILVILVVLQLSFRFYIRTFIPFAQMPHQPIFLFEMINHPLKLSVSFTITVGVVNLFLIYFLSKRLFDDKVALTAAALYAISPWTAYLEVAGSGYALFLAFLLFLNLELLSKVRLFKILSVFAAVGLLTSNIMMLPIILLWIFWRRNFYRYLLLLLPLVFLVIYNPVGSINIFKNQVRLFSDPGLINSVNMFRGESAQTQYLLLSKIFENRYIYYIRHILFNALKHLAPVTYFTPEFKLFNFSFTPPVFAGLLIPFLLGINLLKKLWHTNRKILCLFTIAMLPSIVSKPSPDLERLILISPLIFMTAAWGIQILLANVKSKIYSLVLLIICFLVLFQGFVTFIDISSKEPLRAQNILNHR